MTTNRLAYWPSGGDILATHGRAVPIEDAERLRNLYVTEARAAEAAHDYPTCAVSLRLAMELRRALAVCGRWRRAARVAYGENAPHLCAPPPA